MEILSTLDSKCQERFSPLFKKLNSFVVETPLVEHSYNLPEVVVDKNNGIRTTIAGNYGTDLGTASRIKITQQPYLASITVTRVAIPTSEILVSLKNESYFGYLFDRIMEQMIEKLKGSVGPYNQMRWGEYYIKLEPFSNFVPNGNEEDMIEMRLTTKIASNEKAKGE